ncbi:hypothetical protein Taro_029793 [Colocasia esculenta]|uniref:Fe2OG dioxygenase domain-containing protein n=1 Tax=Colocasia esculenta TaxID=4460 RepID=A0A843VJU7_COLES|nr:hypothetical protein [Colocasia esculenta]
MANFGVAAKYDRTKEVEEFDNSKAGVKGLVDAGVNTIPRLFHHPGAVSSPASPSSNPSLSIPTVDLSLPRARVIELASAAAREWGFFRLVNHGVPREAISAALSAAQAFNELPAEAKAGYYSRKVGGKVTYNSNFDLYHSDVASWRDTLQVVTGAPTPLDAEQIPEVCRRELLEWDEHALGVAKRVLGLLSEGLGVESGRLEENKCLELRVLVSHYYPYCPQPELTLGHDGHTDVVVLTVLVTNEVEGLMVKKEGSHGEWVMVEPVPGSIIVNVGDTLQMISNDEYKSVEHKVAANPHKKARVSIAAFYSPPSHLDSVHYGPLPELISQAKPARYREFTMAEAMGIFASKKLVTKSLINHFRI